MASISVVVSSLPNGTNDRSESWPNVWVVSLEPDTRVPGDVGFALDVPRLGTVLRI